MIDSLGQQGVLTVAATANENWNVDQVGDIPTACPSDYLISVTASNAQDQRTFAAYGPEHIDLAAPGDSIYTTSGSNGYDWATGTSFAGSAREWKSCLAVWRRVFSSSIAASTVSCCCRKLGTFSSLGNR
jgi:subtilisin family serine protease